MTLRLRTLAFCLTVLPLVGHAQQVQNPTPQDIVKFGGQVHAMGESCPQIPATLLDEAKAEQKTIATQSFGVDGTQFEQWYAQGIQEGREVWRQLEAHERQKACDKLARLAL